MSDKPLFVASVAVFNEDGLLLFGKRRDTKKWCLPGGKFESNQSPTETANRELFEETNLVPIDMKFLGHATVNKKDQEIQIYSFRATVKDEPSSELDPDKEFIDFQWVNPMAIPEEIKDNLHNKQDVTLQFLGLQEKTVTKTEGSNWICVDGLKIPHITNPKRLIWNDKYLHNIKETFVKNEEQISECWVNITKVSGGDLPSNKERIKLYRRMLKNGDELPPVVLRYDSDGLRLIDGNHRQEACFQCGVDVV